MMPTRLGVAQRQSLSITFQKSYSVHYAKRPSISPIEYEKLNKMIRIDIAGEVAANRIYEGQKVFLSNIEIINEMHEQEKNHLRILKGIERKYNFKRTKLIPLTHGLAYTLGIERF